MSNRAKQITRSELERALDELISNQRGVDFQRIAVPLARERCPALVASEISKDGGEDAYLIARLPDGKVLSVASSITATLGKIRGDLTTIKKRKSEVNTLWFYTPCSKSTQSIDGWRETIKKDFGVELQVLTREEVVGRLLDPRFHYLAHHHLGFPSPVADEARETHALLARGNTSRVEQWLAQRVDARVHAVGRDYVVDAGEETQGQRLSAGDVAGALISGGLFVIWGAGGIGKSVALGQLARAYSEGPARPIALLVSAPAWARSGQELVTFLGAQFLGEGGRFGPALLSLMETGQLGVFINGWNEVAPEDRTALSQRLSNVLHAAPGCPIVLSSRTAESVGALKVAAYVRVLRLSDETRASLVRQWAPGVVSELQRLVDRDRGVDALSRLPLFLVPLAAALERGQRPPRTRAALLETVLVAMEHSPDHQAEWSNPREAARVRPVLGRIALELSVQGTTEATRAQLLGWIGAACPGVTAEDSTALLERLIQHHVLERDGPDAIRFQHEYFQDWLCAQYLRSQAGSSSTADSQLAQWLNNRRLTSAWGLLVEALTEESTEKEARAAAARLFRLALEVDVQLAAGWLPTLQARLPVPLVQRLTERLQAQYAQGGSARRLAIRAIFATRLPDFAESLWCQLESRNERERAELENRSDAIPVEVLGAEWRTRLLQWSPERRANFVTHQATVASDGDRLALERDFARRDPSARVQARCIQQIAWEDSAAGDALFRTASEEAKGVLLEEGAWNDFSPEVIAPFLPMLEELATFPVTTPRGLRALAYLAQREPNKVIATYREQLQRSRLGAPDYDQALSFLSERDRGWLAEWFLAELGRGARVGMNAAEILRDLPNPRTLLPVLERVLAAPSDAEYQRERALGTLVKVGPREAVERCVEQWLRVHAEFCASGAKDPQLGRHVYELEMALKQARLAPLVDTLLTHRAEVTGWRAVLSIAQMLTRDRGDDDDAGTDHPSGALRELIEHLVTQAQSNADGEGRVSVALATLIGSTRDKGLRQALEQVLQLARTRHQGAAPPTRPIPFLVRSFAGRAYVTAIRDLAGADTLEALLPFVQEEPFDLSAGTQLVEELEAQAGRRPNTSLIPIDWPVVAQLRKGLSTASLSADTQRVAEALDRRIATLGKGASAPLQTEVRAALEVLRGHLVGHVRREVLLAVEVKSQSIYSLVDWTAALIRRGVILPSAWVERLLVWLSSSEAEGLKWEDRTRLLNGGLIALMFSDHPELAAGSLRKLRAEGRLPAGAVADLLVPIAISGIPEQVELLRELVQETPQDSHWWAWEAAVEYLPLAAMQKLIEGWLAEGAVPPAVLRVIEPPRRGDVGATFAAAIAASRHLRETIESRAQAADGNPLGEFARLILARIDDLAAVELLVRLGVSEPSLRSEVGRAVAAVRWPREKGGWAGGGAPRAVPELRQQLLSLTAAAERAVAEWATQLLSDIDASVEDSFPLDEPRHPDLGSGIGLVGGAAFSFP
jgi:hypothetical protein